MACIEAHGLRKAFGATIALDGIDLRVEEGRILGLIGPNGAGKTTALNAILGLTPYQGALQVLGRDPWTQRDQLMRDVAFIADVAVLPRWMRVSQALDYVAGIHPRFDRAKAEGFLAKTTIRHTSKVRELSKGMVTQLHLALVMAIDAKLLVLDEPTLGLDSLFRKQFYDSLLNDYFDRSRTIVITTHQVEEIQYLLTDLIFINRGRILLDSSMEEYEARYLELVVHPERVAAARALKPIHERQVLGRGILLFDRADREQLGALGDVRTPSIADLFVAVVGGQVGQAPQVQSGDKEQPNEHASEYRARILRSADPSTRRALSDPALYWSVRRELWEYRSIYIAPLAAAALFLLGFLHQHDSPSAQLRSLSSIDLAYQHQTDPYPYDYVAGLLMLTAMVVGLFYCLDALHGERRDRSILFWKSLPVSDTHRSARQGEHPARRPSADHLRPHRCHAVDHPARQQRDMAGERPERRHALDTGRHPAHVTGDLLPPAHRPRALACAVLWMAVAGLGVGTARCISMGRAAGNRHRFRREDRLQHFALRHLPGETAWAEVRKRQ